MDSTIHERFVFILESVVANLRRRHFCKRTPGERMVSAYRTQPLRKDGLLVDDSFRFLLVITKCRFYINYSTVKALLSSVEMDNQLTVGRWCIYVFACVFFFLSLFSTNFSHANFLNNFRTRSLVEIAFGNFFLHKLSLQSSYLITIDCNYAGY